MVRSTTLTGVVEDRIRPDRDPVEVDDRPTALRQVSDDDADARCSTWPWPRGWPRSPTSGSRWPASCPGARALAVVLPDGQRSTARPSTLRSGRYKADGTIDDLLDRWLGGKRPTTCP